ncbi:acyltransferase family protein [Pantoea vagans]|uniref:acyltransferase family protein n=1 Tax=Pantoea vagans TaxID=470934 RepID=UPI003516E0C3
MEKLRPNSDIEILRAFAIIMVLVQHFPSLYFWSDHSFFAKVNTYLQFWSGVDLFLCISGFVVSCSLIPLIDQCKQRGAGLSSVVKAFFIKRAFRLFPTSFLWIAIIICMTFSYNISGAFGDIKWNFYQAISILSYTYNLLSHYMLVNSLPTSMGPFWSLNLEEQFYFILPFFIIFTKISHRVPLLLALISVQFFIHRQDTYLMNFRLDSISWGVVLSIFYMDGRTLKFEPRALKNKSFSLALTAIALIYLMLSIPNLHESRYMVGMLALVSAILVFVASFNKEYIYCPRALRKALLWIGSRSYAIYVIHMPAIYFIQEFTVRHYVSIGQAPSKTIYLCLAMTFSALMLTAVLVEASYRLIEVPLRNYGRKLAGRFH